MQGYVKITLNLYSLNPLAAKDFFKKTDFRLRQF